MHTIPRPELLDPDRPLRNDRNDIANDDHRSRADVLDAALRESCRYAKQLWEELDATRAYLLDSLPPDPRTPGEHTRTATAPTGPADDDGWTNWINRFAAVTSALCGPHGDSGFGLGRAREEADRRRIAPVLKIHAVLPAPDPRSDLRIAPTPPRAAPRSRLRTLGMLAVLALAARGLRPRHR